MKYIANYVAYKLMWFLDYWIMCRWKKIHTPVTNKQLIEILERGRDCDILCETCGKVYRFP